MRYPAVLAVTALAVSSCGVGVHFAEYRYRFTPADGHVTGPVSLVVVKSGSGHVNVTTGGDGVTIHRVVRYQSGHPHPGQRLSGGTLTFTDGCRRCSIDYDLTVPAAAGVRATSGSGGIDVTGVASVDARSQSGPIAVRRVSGGVNTGTESGSATIEHVTGAVTGHAESGSLGLTDVRGPLLLSTSSGDISGSGLRSATIRASAVSGDLSLLFTAAPGLVQAKTESGSLRVAVPGGPYNVTADTDSGAKNVSGVPSAPNAASRISLHTSSGALTLEPS